MDLPTSQSSVLSMMALNSKFESQLKTIHSNLSSSIENKVEKSDVYSKDDIDNKLLDYPMKNTVYDKAYINTNYYSATQTDSRFMSLAKNLISATAEPTNDTTYKSLATQELLAEKANTSDVYTKTEVDSKLVSRPSFNIHHFKKSIDTLTYSSQNLNFSIWESGKKFDCENLYVTCSFLFKIKSKSLDPMKNNVFLIDQYPNSVNAGSYPYVTVVAGQQIGESGDDPEKIYEYYAYANFQGLINIDSISEENFNLYFRIVDSDKSGASKFDITEIPTQDIEILLTYREINDTIEINPSS